VNSKPGRSPVVVLVVFGCLADWNQTQQQPQAAGQRTTANGQHFQQCKLELRSAHAQRM